MRAVILSININQRQFSNSSVVSIARYTATGKVGQAFLQTVMCASRAECPGALTLATRLTIKYADNDRRPQYLANPRAE